MDCEKASHWLDLGACPSSGKMSSVIYHHLSKMSTSKVSWSVHTFTSNLFAKIPVSLPGSRLQFAINSKEHLVYNNNLVSEVYISKNNGEKAVDLMCSDMHLHVFGQNKKSESFAFFSFPIKALRT